MAEERELLRVVSHPVRQRIIRLIGERGRVTFSEIRRETGLSVGVIYHHLHVLRDYLVRDGAAYTFNVRGKLLYKLVREGGVVKGAEGSSYARLLRAVLLRGFAQSAMGEAFFKFASPLPFITSSTGCYFTGYVQVGFFFTKRLEANPALSAVASTILIAATLYAATAPIHKMTLSPALLLACASALTPVSLYPLLTLLVPSWIGGPALVALQLLAALFLTSALVNFGGLRTELAALLVLSLLYANAAALMVV